MAKVTIKQGTLRGGTAKTDTGLEYHEYLGIPYAKPPIGKLRFQSPQPPEPWDGERDATTVSENHISCRIDQVTGKLQGSEDCLYLNVFTPQSPGARKPLLPVIVFIHGGGFFIGSGILKSETGPDFLLNHEVVVVTINYRLGVLGFLSLDIPEAAGNMGLKDQIQALRWVQDNIEYFGGDRLNVTIQGISAGSASCEYLILSPLAKGLFHKAILQSGSAINHWAINYESKNLSIKLIEEMGYKGLTEDDQAIYDYLLAAPPELLVGVSTKMIGTRTTKRLFFNFVPIIEKNFGNGDSVLTEHPYILLQEGRFNRVPVIKGFCNQEGYLTKCIKPSAELALTETKNFTNPWPYEFDNIDKEKYNSMFLSAYSENVQTTEYNDQMMVDFFSDFDFVAGIVRSSELFASQNVLVYLYQFCYDGKINFLKATMGLNRKGAAHGDDTGYVLKNTISHLADERDDAVRTIVTKMWTNFAKTGNPTPENSDLQVQWPQFNQNSKMYLDIDEVCTVKSNYEPKKMAIFKDIYNKYKM